MSCGKALQKTEENIPGRIILDKDAVANIAGSHAYSALSPLAAFYQGPAEMKTETIEPSVLNAVLEPERAFFLMQLTRDSFKQEVLLIKESSCYSWVEQDSDMSISKEENPRAFIEKSRKLLIQQIKNKETSLVSIKKKSLRVLAAAAALCKALSNINDAASFTTISHIGSLLGEEVLQSQIKELSQQGFISCIGDDDPLIVLEKKGEDLLLLLNEYDRYFIIQILTEGAQEYPSFNFAAKNGTLSLITNPNGSDDIVIRALDPDGVSSLINWAWTKTL